VNQFVEECRSEWRRLGVPDPVANEMAADLTADLEEAEAEGGSAEDVLGNSAFDPRRFAASWAAARGVTAPPTPDNPYHRRAPLAIALTTLMGILTIGGLGLLIAYRGGSVAVAVRRAVATPGPIRLFAPGPNRLIGPGPLGPIRFGPASSLFVGGVDTHPLAWIMLIVGVVGLGLAVLYWSPWSVGHRRNRHREGPPNPSWN
jgi:hypothetical protein